MRMDMKEIKNNMESIVVLHLENINSGFVFLKSGRYRVIIFGVYRF